MPEFLLALLETSKDVVEYAKMQRDKEVSRHGDRVLRRVITKTLTVKQFESTVAEIVESLSPVFKRQIKSISDRLLEIETKSYEEQAHVLSSLVFEPQIWDKEIVDNILPVLALNMVRAGVTQLLIFGIDVRKLAVFNRKTTASEWLESNSDDYDDLIGTLEETSIGTAANIRFMSEIPVWMQAAIMDELAVSFSQDYWRSISITTQGDAERILRKGLLNGWSIRKMAREMTASLGGDRYARIRATKIARTESGNALNAIRRTSIDKLTEELGPAIPITKMWLSVLSDATRDSHADLDGVPADSEGLWNLDGVQIPYPAHYSLPPENRIHCMCTIVTELGISNEEAQRLIAEHEQRVIETNTETE